MGGIRLTQRNSREEGSFREPNEEPADGEARTAGHSRHADCTKAPRHHHRRQKPSWIRFCKPQVTWKLTNKIPNVESRDAGIPYGITHVQVFLQPGKARVGHIDTIEVATFGKLEKQSTGRLNLLHKEHECNDWHESPIKSLDQLLVQGKHLLLAQISK